MIPESNLNNNMPSSTPIHKNILAFGWKEKSTPSNGQVRFERVKLYFDGLQTKISVRIPENVPLNKIQKLDFTCSKNEKESTCEMIKVAPEQIQNLAIEGIFSNDCLDPNFPKKISEPEKIKLEVAESFEPGAKYYLVITSDHHNLEAKLIKDDRIAPFSKYAVTTDLVKYILKFLLPQDLCRVMRVCKQWNEIASDIKFWATLDLKTLSPLVKVFDESFWNEYYDLSSSDVSFKDAEKINKEELILTVKKLMTLSREEKEFGVAILTLPKKLTLKKFIDLSTSPKKGHETFFRYVWQGVEQIKDIEIEKTHTVVITNILHNSYNMSFDNHQAMLNTLGCEMPTVIHVCALAIFTFASSTNKPPLRLLKNVYAGCVDYHEKMKRHFAVGIFRPPRKAPSHCVGLVVDFRLDSRDLGMMAMKKL